MFFFNSKNKNKINIERFPLSFFIDFENNDDISYFQKYSYDRYYTSKPYLFEQYIIDNADSKNFYNKILLVVIKKDEYLEDCYLYIVKKETKRHQIKKSNIYLERYKFNNLDKVNKYIKIYMQHNKDIEDIYNYTIKNDGIIVDEKENSNGKVYYGDKEFLQLFKKLKSNKYKIMIKTLLGFILIMSMSFTYLLSQNKDSIYKFLFQEKNNTTKKISLNYDLIHKKKEKKQKIIKNKIINKDFLFLGNRFFVKEYNPNNNIFLIETPPQNKILLEYLKIGKWIDNKQFKLNDSNGYIIINKLIHSNK